MATREDVIARLRAIRSRLPRQETEPGAVGDLLAEIAALAPLRKRAITEALGDAHPEDES